MVVINQRPCPLNFTFETWALIVEWQTTNSLTRESFLLLNDVGEHNYSKHTSTTRLLQHYKATHKKGQRAQVLAHINLNFNANLIASMSYNTSLVHHSVLWASTFQTLQRPPRPVSLPSLSHHSLSRATTWGATVLDRSKTWAQLLRPNNKTSTNTAFGEITRNTPLLARGVLGASNVQQRVFTHVPENISPTVTLLSIS